jgi:hypothetical protein
MALVKAIVNNENSDDTKHALRILCFKKDVYLDDRKHVCGFVF